MQELIHFLAPWTGTLPSRRHTVTEPKPESKAVTRKKKGQALQLLTPQPYARGVHCSRWYPIHTCFSPELLLRVTLFGATPSMCPFFKNKKKNHIHYRCVVDRFRPGSVLGHNCLQKTNPRRPSIIQIVSSFTITQPHPLPLDIGVRLSI
ncbi:hypothetical protein EDB86DRAFT_2979304 [Lactarius hatsudake]|nr:hypothetical protein EDB86DRAFT_2979304 [Lactarius hatsudake]